jgi:hypothetical protein
VGARQTNRYFVFSRKLGGGKLGHCRVRIHAAKCGYRNEGCGTRFGGGHVRGTWHGPYDYDRAFQFAESLAIPDTRTCHRCMRAVIAAE